MADGPESDRIVGHWRLGGLKARIWHYPAGIAEIFAFDDVDPRGNV